MNQVALRAISPVIAVAVNRSMSGLAGTDLAHDMRNEILSYEKEIADIKNTAISQGRELNSDEVYRIKVKENAIDFCKSRMSSPLAGITPIYRVISTASAAASAYHGYKRNKSVGWAIWWFLMGGLFPVITPAIAYAQGFGKERDEAKK